MITFTIATCTYNAGNELPPTLQSVLEQDYPYVEHLIIDGASKDNTMSLLEDYKRNNGHSAKGHKINIVSEPDSGLYDAMNKAHHRFEKSHPGMSCMVQNVEKAGG